MNIKNHGSEKDRGNHFSNYNPDDNHNVHGNFLFFFSYKLFIGASMTQRGDIIITAIVLYLDLSYFC